MIRLPGCRRAAALCAAVVIALAATPSRSARAAAAENEACPTDWTTAAYRVDVERVASSTSQITIGLWL